MQKSELSATGVPRLPDADRCEIFLDFDGTITQCDVLDELIARFAADDSWKESERLWQAGEIGSFECLSKEFSVLRITPRQLDQFLDGISLDPGVGCLFQLLREAHTPVTILSDGVDVFIRRLLARLPAECLPENFEIRANAIVHRGERIELVCPHANPNCETGAANCKCSSARLQPGRRPIYIGDGLSDLCPARKFEAVFAKGRLAEILRSEGKLFFPFVTLDDVTVTLAKNWEMEGGGTCRDLPKIRFVGNSKCCRDK